MNDSDARRFRFVTILHVIIPVVLVVLLCYLMDPPRRIATSPAVLRTFPPNASLSEWAWASIWPVAVLLVALALALLAATDITSYFFRPRDEPVHLQNRALALSHYASAPLAWTFIPLALGFAGYSIERTHALLGVGVIMLSIMLSMVELGVWWLDPIRLLRRVMPRHKHRARFALVAQPVLWFVMFVGILGTSALLIVYLSVVAESLR